MPSDAGDAKILPRSKRGLDLVSDLLPGLKDARYKYSTVHLGLPHFGMSESQLGHFCTSCILSQQHSCAMTLVSVTPSRVHMYVWPCGTLWQYFEERTDLSTATFEHHEKQ